MVEYNWPGNVRQLENLIKRMVVLGTEAPIFKELQQPTAAPLGPRNAPAIAFAPRVAPAPAPVAAASAAVPAAAAMTGTSAFASDGTGTVSLKEIARKAAQEAECALIQRMLTRTCWNRKEAAEILGISYKALLYKIKENGLDRAS
jgi:two-component system response regulator AtoC